MKQVPTKSSVSDSVVGNFRQTLVRSFRLVHWRVWRGRLVVWISAAVVSLVVIGFSTLVDYSTTGFFWIQANSRFTSLLLTPVGGMLVVYLTRRFFAGAEGSGIPQVIAALKAHDNHKVEGRLVSVRIAMAKVVLGSLAIFFGFSSGKEGPAVQVGASLMHSFKRFLPAQSWVRSEHLLLAGGAAGVAVAFNTPIAGVVFAIEELGRKFDRSTNLVLLTAIVIAGAIASFHWGNFTYFGHIPVGNATRASLMPIVVVGIAGGVLGGLFARFMVIGSHPTMTAFGRLRSRYPVWFAGACGLGVALLGLMSHDLINCGGYKVTQAALEGGVSLPPEFATEKMAATLLSYFSGIPGGIFAPCLSIGAAMGQEIYGLGLGHVDMAVWMALGMAAFLAGVTQVPMTAFVIVMEMIDGHSMVLSLITVTLLASMVSKVFSQSPYHALGRQALFSARARDRIRNPTPTEKMFCQAPLDL